MTMEVTLGTRALGRRVSAAALEDDQLAVLGILHELAGGGEAGLLRDSE